MPNPITEPSDALRWMALDYLSRNPLLHMDMMEAIRRGEAKLLRASGLGVLLFHPVCQAYMLSTADREEAGRMLSSLSGATLVVAHQDFYLPEARERLSLATVETVRQAAYRRGVPLPEPTVPFRLQALGESQLDFVHRHYTHSADRDYLSERLRSGAILGAFAEDGRLAGFIGMHAEGTIGMLEVLPEFRRQGIAEALEIRMINRCLARGFTPFAQVAPDNAASLSLQRKLGFELSDECVHWLY
ncbi:GNAT family N-acetyltransferase [Gorillibacterium sp. sgz500922]|uniref:GNAT family N-acetyltransferase n=1 Tax=Gorillibacterium sp. sgz500922 TaxID=3446694 RepID=UPI003F67D24A